MKCRLSQCVLRVPVESLRHIPFERWPCACDGGLTGGHHFSQEERRNFWPHESEVLLQVGTEVSVSKFLCQLLLLFINAPPLSGGSPVLCRHDHDQRAVFNLTVDTHSNQPTEQQRCPKNRCVYHCCWVHGRWSHHGTHVPIMSLKEGPSMLPA